MFRIVQVEHIGKERDVHDRSNNILSYNSDEKYVRDVAPYHGFRQNPHFAELSPCQTRTRTLVLHPQRLTMAQ